ncbi:hypothetical protein CTEN210_12879 [Chaetoceros tenuissimus]|uniref:Uncharacterized protein n=1 Tax=Chaetoceros tenuissimus TaxID=426638 RepID=A0AAD3HAX8_9STRA|nr:hypothetical protein CTEN210_12879 [Chaetoceros tenuissimus]
MNTSVNAENFDIPAIQKEFGELRSSGEWPKGASASTIAYLTSIGQWPIKTSDGKVEATSGPPPANDLCADATEITSFPFNIVADTTHAIWYKVTGTGGVMTAETVLPYLTLTDTMIHVYTGSCDGLTCVDGNDCRGPDCLSLVSWQSEPGVDYYIMVNGWGSGIGAVNLEVLTTEVPSMVPSDSPSSLPSFAVPSSLPSFVPSSEPSWLDDEQCKKKDPENDICAELDGRCKVDCEDDENFVCVPGLCSYDRYWDKPTKSPKTTKSPEMRKLKKEEVDVVDIEVTADGHTERKLKATKAPSEKETKTTKPPKATKAPKSSCACRVPRRNGCN